MRSWIGATIALGFCTAASATPLSTIDCARIAAQVDRERVAVDLDVPELIRDGDPGVSAAARRFQALHAETSSMPAALVNAIQDLRYQLQVCARR